MPMPALRAEHKVLSPTVERPSGTVNILHIFAHRQSMQIIEVQPFTRHMKAPMILRFNGEYCASAKEGL